MTADYDFAKLTPWQKTQVARHPNRPYMLDYVSALFTEFIEVHGDRRYGDDPALVTGLRALQGPARRAGRPPEGPRHQAEDLPQLRHAEARGLPQGAARDAAGGEVRPADLHLRRHPRRLSGPRRRGARPGRGHRLQPPRDGRPAHADRGQRDRRGRQRRRPGHRGRRPGEHARALRLLGDLPRGLRVDPLARRRAGGGGGDGDEDHRPRPRGLRHHRRDRPRAARRRAQRLGRDVPRPRRRPGPPARRAVRAVPGRPRGRALRQVPRHGAAGPGVRDAPTPRLAP